MAIEDIQEFEEEFDKLKQASGRNTIKVTPEVYKAYKTLYETFLIEGKVTESEFLAFLLLHWNVDEKSGHVLSVEDQTNLVKLLNVQIQNRSFANRKRRANTKIKKEVVPPPIIRNEIILATLHCQDNRGFHTNVIKALENFGSEKDRINVATQYRELYGNPHNLNVRQMVEARAEDTGVLDLFKEYFTIKKNGETLFHSAFKFQRRTLDKQRLIIKDDDEMLRPTDVTECVKELYTNGHKTFDELMEKYHYEEKVGSKKEDIQTNINRYFNEDRITNIDWDGIDWQKLKSGLWNKPKRKK